MINMLTKKAFVRYIFVHNCCIGKQSRKGGGFTDAAFQTPAANQTAGTDKKKGSVRKMGITGIGSSSTYIYNIKTGKLATKDGSKDDFVDYFNGDISGKQSDSLNGYDVRKKRDINAMIMLYQSMTGSNVKGLFQEKNGDEYEITSNIVDGVTAQYSVNGEKVFKAYDMNVFHYVDYTPPEELLNRLHGAAVGGSDNSIHFGAGDVFDLGGGYSLEVREDGVYVNGLGNGSEDEDEKAKQLAGGLNSLLRSAGKQWASELIDKESTPMILSLLRELGIDTDKTFRVNGTKYEVRDGRIQESGNRFGIQDSVFREAMKKYEDALSMTLS